MPQTRGRKRKRSFQVTQEEPRDPLTYLNIDMINTVFSYLTLTDLVRNERVSRHWKNIIESWIIAVGLRLRFPHTQRPSQSVTWPDGQAYREFKLQARHHETLKSGKPSSVLKFGNVTSFISSGDYVTWKSKFDNHVTNRCLTDRVYWQCITRDGEQATKEPEVIRATRFSSPGASSYIDGISLNSDGILLLNLQSVDASYELWCARSVIYSTLEKKVIWRQDHRERSERDSNSDIFPLVLGKHTVYCANKSDEHYNRLCAFDFRTGAHLYQSSLKIDTNWAQDLISNEFSLTTSENLRLIQAADGEELLLHLTKNGGGTSYHSRTRGLLEIINGKSGHITRYIDFPETKLDSFLRQPLSDNAVIVSEITRLPKSLYETTNEPLLYSRFIILRKLTCLLGTSPGPLRTDFLIAPRDCLIKPNYHPHSPMTVHPFHRLALVSSEQFYPSSNDQWSVWSRPLIPTSDQSHRDLAKFLIELVFPFETPILDTCFVLGDQVSLTLPTEPRRGRQVRIQLGLLPTRTEWAQFIEGGRVLLSGMDTDTKYLLNF